MIGRIAQSQAFGALRTRSIPGKGPKAAIIQAGQERKEFKELTKNFIGSAQNFHDRKEASRLEKIARFNALFGSKA